MKPSISKYYREENTKGFFLVGRMVSLLKQCDFNRPKLHFEKGVTLIELVVSVGILGFVLTALLGLFVEMLNLNNMSRDMTLATSHAQYVLEDIRSSSGVIINQIDNYEWDFDTDAKFAEKGLMRINNEIIEVNYDDTKSPMPIIVSVDWQSQNGRQESLTFVTVDTGV